MWASAQWRESSCPLSFRDVERIQYCNIPIYNTHTYFCILFNTYKYTKQMRKLHLQRLFVLMKYS